MKKVELKNQVVELVKELTKKYPAVINDLHSPMIRVVEYQGVKYEIDYKWNTHEISSIYKEGDERAFKMLYDLNVYSKELKNVITSIKSILKGTEIQDGPVLQVVENNRTIPYYSATIRFECEIDAQNIFGVFAKLNDWELEKEKGYMVLIEEYKGSRTSMGSPTAKLTISSDYSINDIKAILLNFDGQLPDCHVAIQSLDYAQFEGARDRSSHYPSEELVEDWSNKLNNLKKVA